MPVVVEFDLRKMRDLGEGLLELGESAENSRRLALNRTLDWTYTRVVRKVTDATGIQSKRVRLIIKKFPLKAGGETAAIRARDGYTSLKDFRPHQTAKGVSAAPWGKRRVFPGTFIGPNGHVYKREKSGPNSGHRIVKLWGPAIPKEMTDEKAIRPILNEAMATIFPKHLEFFLDRAEERVKSKFGL
jgi:hypothetical protein